MSQAIVNSETKVSENDKKDLDRKAPLWSNGFVALLITQFMVALNDNLFRWLIIPIGKYAVGWSDSPDKVRMLGAVVFLVPYLIFTSYAGFCTDRFNRKKVLVSCKIAEVIIILMGTAAILAQSVHFMLVVLFLLGAQSAFFSPAKYSSLPSVVPANRISEANGFYAMTTMIACIAGQVLGGCLFVWTTIYPNGNHPIEGTGGMHNWWIWASVLIGVAVIGLISSLFIPSIPSVDPQARFPWNPFRQTFADLGFLYKNKKIFWIAMGSAFFWGLGALAQLNIDKFATDQGAGGVLFVRQDEAMILLVILTLGIAAGSLLAGIWSRGRVELGLVPLGIFFLISSAVFLGFTPTVELEAGQKFASVFTFPFFYSLVGLILIGISVGIYDIPLVTSLQTRTPEQTRGRILAAYNFFSFAAMAVFSWFGGVLCDPSSCGLNIDGLNAKQVWLFCALISLPILFFAVKHLFLPLISVLTAGYLWLFYRPRVIGLDNIPAEGGVLLVSNHVSYLDSLFIFTQSKRPIRFIADEAYIPKGFPNYLADKTGVIRIKPGDRRSIVNMLREARQALKNGEAVCIFAEGGLTRTGQIKTFQDGFLSILKGNEDCPIVPVYLSELWNSRFAYTQYKDPQMRSQKLLRRPTVAFGKPVKKLKGAWELWQIINELGVDSMNPNRFPKDKQYLIPARMVLRICKKFAKQERIADSTGLRLTGYQTLLRILILRRALKRFLTSDEQFIGLLLPTSVGGVLANVGVSFIGRVPVNLNYTFTNETINYCINRVGIKHVLTSKKLLNKIPNLKPDAELLYIEDLLKEVSRGDKIFGLIESLLPLGCLERLLGLTKIKPSEINTIIFTSGSTGLPKGAMLSHSNISSNMQAFMQVLFLTQKDRLFEMLPLFHSFGYTTGIWAPLSYPISCFYHYSPLDSKLIGELAAKEKATTMATTPTFLRNYMRRCPKECFENVDVTIAGAEKTPKDLNENWQNKYGHPISEGFGMTELSPVLAVNTPPTRRPDQYASYYREGSIGRPCPGFAVRIVDSTTGELLPPNTDGMLEVKGPCVMLGYYDEPEKTAASYHDDWFVTGDIARLDEDGFIFITGRETRMSKIGGEMVPHILIEEKLAQIVADLEKTSGQTAKESDNSKDFDVPTVRFAVAAVPDEKKGEKIVVLYTDIPVDTESICKMLINKGMPSIWVPAPCNFHQVEKIPLLGSGKLDLASVKKRVKEIYQLD